MTPLLQRLPLIALIMAGLYLTQRTFGWPALLLAFTGGTTWLLVSFTRMMRVMQRAAQQPVGYVDSAEKLQKQLQTGFRLLQVVTLARSLGKACSPENEQPEVFRWTDTEGTSVIASFTDGRLTHWVLERPAPEDKAADTDPSLAP